MKNPRKRALQWLGKQLFNRDDPAAFFDPLLEPVNPMWVRKPEYAPARVERIVQETSDTKTFVLRPAGRWSGFRAGQHVNICIEIEGVRRNRTFSLSSSPKLWQEQGQITLTVKRLPGGLVTNWLHDHLQPGEVIGLGDAFGDFLAPKLPEPVLFIAGGSGITPILSQLETLLTDGFEAPVTLLYYVRSTANVIARERLTAMAERYPSLTLTIIPSQETARPRHLTDGDLEKVPGLGACQVYVCGPEGLMALARERLDKREIPEGHIHCTFFTAPVADLGNQQLGGKVQFAKSGLDVSSEGDTPLLQMAEAAGLSPRHGCRMGICHQCSCRKTTGTVVNHLTGEASGPGEETIQLCISIPRGPVVIDA